MQAFTMNMLYYATVLYSDKGTFSFMQPPIEKQVKNGASAFLYLKCGAILSLFLLSALIVACSTSGTPTTANLSEPTVTVTIQLGNSDQSPTPTASPYYCGAWVTNATPSSAAGTVVVNAKFTQNVNGNPVGIGDATAQATVLWADGTSEALSVTTTSDGLAIFDVALPTNTQGLLNKETLVTITFAKAGIPTCTVDQARAAYFVVVQGTPMVTPTATIGLPNPVGGRRRKP